MDVAYPAGVGPGRRSGRPRAEPRHDAATHDIVDRLFREEQGRAVATLIRVLGDFDLAEEAVQDAFIAALEVWPDRGVPANPGAWITTTARNRAIDRLRRRRRLRDKTDELARDAAIEAELAAIEPDTGADDDMPIADDRLRLIFTCCHPALPLDGRVALTLRTLGGLTTPEIARAFLVPEPTLAQRLVRAKRKIREAGIPYRVPPRELLPERLGGVLKVLYLVFNEGYAASSGDALVRRELSAEAIRLARTVVVAAPRRARGGRAAGAHAPPRRSTRGARRRGRRPRPARGPGPVALGRRADRRRAGAHRAARCALGRRRAVPDPGGDRGAARRGRLLGGDRLAADRRAVSRASWPSSHRRSSSSTSASPWRWPRGRPSAWR